MLYSKILPRIILRSRKEELKFFLLYMGMAAILFSGAEPFKQIDSTLSTEGLV